VRTLALSPKQKKFVGEYLIDLNASASLLRAGYRSKNPDVDGHKLLVKPSISKAIALAMAERAKRTEITADRVLQQLAKIGFVDIKDVVTWAGNRIRIRPSEEIDGTLLAEISETETENGGTLKIKLNDRMKALELLGKHLGMFTDKLEVNGAMVIFKGENDLED